MNTNNIEHMSDDDLLKEINVYDPYDVEFARRFRALAARVAEVESERDKMLGHANRQEDRAEAAEARMEKLKAALYLADKDCAYFDLYKDLAYSRGAYNLARAALQVKP